MSYIKFEHRHLGDARWLDVSPAAFVVHAWALDYCNEQATDGHVDNKIAARLVCPVLPGELPDAWAELCAVELWECTPTGYFCPTFTAYGIAAEEQRATRQKWSDDKRRQRLHAIGNHDLCSPRRCPAAHLSTSGQVEASTPGQVDDPTRPDSTRPDQTPVGGSGRGSGGSAGRPAHGFAALAATETRGRQEPTPPPSDPEERLGIPRHPHAPGCCVFGDYPHHQLHQSDVA